jgi:hypothetical protein
MLQSTFGVVNRGPDVVCEKIPATPYDQSQATIFPGAVDVLPLNVQLSVFPPFVIVHVSDSVGPVTPKLAVATVGFVTDRTADARPPPYAPLIVPSVVVLTTRVDTPNTAAEEPKGTVTLCGTVSGSEPVNVTTAPLGGAAAVSITVPVTAAPPTTFGALSEIDARATGPTMMFNVGDGLLLPFSEAVMTVVPVETPTIAKATLDAPAAIMTDEATVATAGLLLVSATLAPPVGAMAVSRTAP